MFAFSCLPSFPTEICAADCGGHGVCVGGTCRCEDGWMGAACDQRACHPRCAEHGTCRDGKCECSPGWNGEHCTIGMVGQGPGVSLLWSAGYLASSHPSPHPGHLWAGLHPHDLKEWEPMSFHLVTLSLACPHYPWHLNLQFGIFKLLAPSLYFPGSS